MPLHLNPITMPLSLMTFWVIFGGNVQAQFYESPYHHGHLYHAHDLYAYPPVLPHAYLTFDHDVLTGESYELHSSSEPIDTHRPFTSQPLHGLLTMDDTFGDCLNTVRCPNDVRNFAGINDQQPAYVPPVRPYGLPPTQYPDGRGLSRSSTPHPNSPGSHQHEGIPHEGHAHDEDSHEGHAHAHEFPTSPPSDRHPMTLPTLPRTAPTPNVTGATAPCGLLI